MEQQSPNERRLEDWMRTYGTAILRTCFVILSDAREAEDAMQDTFLRAWRAMDTFELIGLDVLHRHSVARVFLGLLGNIDNHQREDQVVHIVLFGQCFALDEVTREVDMGTELSGEFEGLDQAFQFRLAPVPHGLCQLHASSAPPRWSASPSWDPWIFP